MKTTLRSILNASPEKYTHAAMDKLGVCWLHTGTPIKTLDGLYSSSSSLVVTDLVDIKPKHWEYPIVFRSAPVKQDPINMILSEPKLILRDKTGEIVKPYQVLIQKTGCGSHSTYGGVWYNSYNVYFLKQVYEHDGAGWQWYKTPERGSFSGKFSWVDVDNSYIIIDTPKGFLEAVKEGLQQIEVPREVDENGDEVEYNSYKEILEKSDWKERVKSGNL